MNSPAVAPVTATPDLAALREALLKVYPEAARAFFPDDKVYRYEGGVSLGLDQGAWIDTSYGWQAESEIPVTRTSELTYHPCPLGGRFYRSIRSIGD